MANFTPMQNLLRAERGSFQDGRQEKFYCYKVGADKSVEVIQWWTNKTATVPYAALQGEVKYTIKQHLHVIKHSLSKEMQGML